MNEQAILGRLRRIATSAAARGLLDDAALLDGFVITHDSIAEGVHFFPFDPPASVGWKLAAVNLSDLAAKGASPAGALLSLTISGDGSWEDHFLSGLEAACESYGLPLIGGDTIALPPRSPRVLWLTAIGRAGERTPARNGARAGDALWVVGTIGDAAAGLAQLRAESRAVGPLVDIYRRPVPLLAAGRVLAPVATAMMDVSDGLLLDTRRLAEASGCQAVIDLEAVPISDSFQGLRGSSPEARMFAATGGDDYALLGAFPPDMDPVTDCLPAGTRVTRIGNLEAGTPGIRVRFEGSPVEVPETLGYEHRSDPAQPYSPAPLGDRP
jgi:thiamine-monophosphate kinase